MVVRPNYVVVYAELGDVIAILRVLHAAQQWPPLGSPSPDSRRYGKPT